MNQKKTDLADANDSPELLPWGPRGTAAATIAAGLSFNSIGKRFDNIQAVENFSLTIKPGEIVCLLGPSGCGKTTLLRIAAGIELPDEGAVLLNDREVSGENAFVPPENRNVGLMFQDFALFPHLSILDNVAFGLKSLGKTEAVNEAKAALRRVGLGQYATSFPHLLSGGQQQRVALARAIAPRPGVLLMDEPFSGLDPRLRDTIREETLAILRETRATCLIVTHHAEEAMRMGDRIAVMRNGRLVQVATGEELYRKPRNLFVARMFSEINEVPCEIRGQKLLTPFGEYPAGKNVSAGTGLLCVRHRGILMVAPEQGTPGRVIARKFLGDAALVELAVEGVENALFARVREREAPETGTEIGVNLDVNEVMFFQENQDPRENIDTDHQKDGSNNWLSDIQP